MSRHTENSQNPGANIVYGAEVVTGSVGMLTGVNVISEGPTFIDKALGLGIFVAGLITFARGVYEIRTEPIPADDAPSHEQPPEPGQAS